MRLGWQIVLTCGWLGCGGAPTAPAVPAEPAPVVEPALPEAPSSCVVGEETCGTRQRCVDVVGDACDPAASESPCPGTCQRCDDPSLDRTYFETSLVSCARIRVRCGENQRPFSDACGCGCERSESTAD